MTQPSQLHVRSLTKTYANGVHALRGVDLDIGPGMFGLLGPNGAGKSTFMRTLATLQLPDAGSLRLGEIDILTQPDALRRVLGYLPQDFGVYPHMTPLALLDHFAVLKGITVRSERKAMVEGLLARVNLWDARNKRLGGFSGGMKQRFGIAQALLGTPQLVIVDEPTAGLDPEERTRFLNLLAEIGENVVILLSTHIVDDVADLCRDMAIFAGGRVLQRGNPRSAIDELRGKTWRRTIDKSEILECEAEHVVLSTRLVSGQQVIHIFCETDPRASFSPVEPDLQDVYFTALRRSA